MVRIGTIRKLGFVGGQMKSVKILILLGLTLASFGSMAIASPELHSRSNNTHSSAAHLSSGRIVFGSNNDVYFVVQLDRNNNVIGGYHRNNYTGRHWSISGGQLMGNRLIVYFESYSNSCDSGLSNEFILRNNDVVFARSQDRCGNVSYPNALFGYM